MVVKDKIINATNYQLKSVKKDRIEGIIEHLYDKILTRIYYSEERKVHKLQFMFDIGSTFIGLNFLEKRIDGAKFIQDVCKKLLKN